MSKAHLPVTALPLGLALVAGCGAWGDSRPRDGVLSPTDSGTGPWPNEPAGFRVAADNGFNILTGDGWDIVDNTSGLLSIAADTSAPLSPPFVIQYKYPVGFAGGVGPGAVFHDLPGYRKVFVGLWWKPSAPWQGHVSGSNKIQYVRTESQGTMFMAMYGEPGGPYEVRVYPQFSTSRGLWLVPNVNRVPVALGKWHRVEWLIVYNSTADPPNGIVRWWLDGRLIGDYFNVEFPPQALTEYKLSAIWGGAEQITKTEDDFFWYDHVHISGK